MKMKLVFSSNVAWSIYNFRLDLLKSLQKDGCHIYTVAAKDKYVKKLTDQGFVFTPIRINNNGTNPLKDFLLLFQYLRIYKSINPDVICHNGIKPNIYGTIAAGLLRIPVVNNISGLGTLFIKRSIATKIAMIFYRFSQKLASKVLFQNTFDLRFFIQQKIVKPRQVQLIHGSGVDTTLFKSVKSLKTNTPFTFLFVGRLLKDKGIIEFIEAAKHVKSYNSDVIFNVLGPIYTSNSTAINSKDVKRWMHEDQLINYLGESEDVRVEMQNADCLVLPSYREGLSKVLIEASSMSLPIITTNVPGCKDVVVDKVTGFLCRARDAEDLALKMQQMLNLDDSKRHEMGQLARQRAIDIYDVKHIINTYKSVIYQSHNSRILQK